MTGHDDDLSPWNDDPLVRALRGPGTADELASRDEFMAAFRAAPAARRPTPIGSGRLRRAGRRLGGGGTAVVAAIALGAGAAAAAAYTQNLPDPGAAGGPRRARPGRRAGPRDRPREGLARTGCCH